MIRMIAAAAIVLAIVCSTAMGKATPVAKACKSSSFVYHDDCVVTFQICSVSAARQAKAYYLGHGKSLDAIATTYTRGYTNVAAQQGAYQGCITALENAYHRLG